MKAFNIKDFLTEVKGDTFFRSCGIPMGYKCGCPLLRTVGEDVLLILPYRKMKRSDVPEKFGVLPVAYALTYKLNQPIEVPAALAEHAQPEKGHIPAVGVGFEALKYDPRFQDVTFGQPIGIFPHQEMADLGPKGCREKTADLYSAYDKVIQAMMSGEKVSAIDRMELKRMLKIYAEPSLKPMYAVLAPDFAKQYLN